MAIRGSSCLVSSCKISHFDINPVNGGRPAKERRIAGTRLVIIGAWAQDVASLLMVVALLVLKAVNVEKVITK